MSKSNPRYMDTRRAELILALSGMSGAEDPGVVTPPVPDPGTPPAPPSDPPTLPETPEPQPNEDRTYTKAEMDKEIAESKKYRQRAQTAEGKLSDREKADMTETERAKTEAAELKAENEKLKTSLSRVTLEKSVVAEAKDFTDPVDVLSFLDIASIKLDDDGKPDTNSLKAAIKRLATDKPYLLKTNAGNGDGGARGGHAVDKSTDYEKEYQSRGMVPIS